MVWVCGKSIVDRKMIVIGIQWFLGPVFDPGKKVKKADF